MTRLFLPMLLAAAAYSAPAQAQSENAFWDGQYLGFSISTQLSSSVSQPGVPAPDAEIDGIFYGAQYGFWRRSDDVLFGAEFSFARSSADLEQPGIADVNVSARAFRLGGQVGYDLGEFMPHAILGVSRFTFNDTIGFGDTSSNGFFGGVGVDYQVNDFSSVGFEVLHESYDSFNEGADLDLDQTTFGLQYRLKF